MTPQRLSQLESEFALRFPREYREAVCANPPTLDCEDFNADADELAKLNVVCRQNSPEGFEWHSSLWCVGTNGGSGVYYLDCNHTVPHVYFLDWKDPVPLIPHYLNTTPRSLPAYIKRLQEYEADFGKFRDDYIARIKSRRWWQFWIPRSAPKWALEKSRLPPWCPGRTA